MLWKTGRKRTQYNDSATKIINYNFIFLTESVSDGDSKDKKTTTEQSQQQEQSQSNGNNGGSSGQQQTQEETQTESNGNDGKNGSKTTSTENQKQSQTNGKNNSGNNGGSNASSTVWVKICTTSKYYYKLDSLGRFVGILTRNFFLLKSISINPSLTEEAAFKRNNFFQSSLQIQIIDSIPILI